MTGCTRCGSEWHSVSRCPWPSLPRFEAGAVGFSVSNGVTPWSGGAGRMPDFNSRSVRELNEINNLAKQERGHETSQVGVH